MYFNFSIFKIEWCFYIIFKNPLTITTITIIIITINIIIKGNSTLESLLPGVVDGAIGLVLGSQGPEVSKDIDSSSVDIPQGYELIYDEAKNFKYQ